MTNRRRPVTYNRRNPPRFKIVVEVKESLLLRLNRASGWDKSSRSKLINDLLCEGFDIPPKER